MKTFLINLDKNGDRLRYMTRRLESLGVSFERIPGVLGAALPPEERVKLFSAFRSFLCEGRRLSPGEIGCAVSHCKVYQKIVDDDLPFALILEDDVALADGLSRILTEISRFVDWMKPQVVLLSAHGSSCESRKAMEIERIYSGLCTDAYVITNAAARVILHANLPVVAVADRWSRWQKRFGLELYRAWPMTAWQDKDRFPESDVSEHLSRLRGAKLAIHRVLRMMELTTDWVLYKITGV